MAFILSIENRWFLITSRYSMELEMKSEFNDSQQKSLWPNLKNLSGGLNLSRGLNMVGST